MTTPAITLPSPRTPVVTVDAQGILTFSRAWFLFFQAIWNKTGGAVNDPAAAAGQAAADAQTLTIDADDTAAVDALTLRSRLHSLEALLLDADLGQSSGAGGSSAALPVTMKGDLLGFDTAPDRIPVGQDGMVLTADSAQALGLGWAAAPGADFDATGWRLAPVIWGGGPASVYGGVLGLDGGNPATDYAGFQPLDASDNNVNQGVGISIDNALVGPQGIQGLQGTPATNTLQVFEFFAAVAGAQSVPLPYPLGSGWYLLTINGMRQRPTAYSVSTSSLTLPAELSVLQGDLISFEYYTPTI